MCRAAHSRLGLCQLRVLRLGPVRVSEPAQLSLPVEAGAARPRELTVLDQRQRGTHFLSIGARSVLNSPASTGMGFWSINPYVGCEFGCTYCYARDTHRYAVERSGVPPEPLPAWEAFERRILCCARRQGTAQQSKDDDEKSRCAAHVPTNTAQRGLFKEKGASHRCEAPAVR